MNKSLQPPLVQAKERIKELEQALWDIYGILGFDQDGDPTPSALVHPDITVLVVDAAKEFRQIYDEEIAISLYKEQNKNED